MQCSATLSKSDFDVILHGCKNLEYLNQGRDSIRSEYESKLEVSPRKHPGYNIC